MADKTPTEILDLAYSRAIVHLADSIINDREVEDRLRYVARNKTNRSGVRLLLSCLLAKIHDPSVDVRKPYTRIGEPDAFSGRHYDEKFVAPFIYEHDLPCNDTTAFLTPALRNRNIVLTPDINLEGSPPQMYRYALQLLDDVHIGRVQPDDLLAQLVKELIVYRSEQRQSLETILAGMARAGEGLPLSSEGIVSLIQQHMASPRSSRLPVLVVAAAYKAAENFLGERVLPLYGHNAADSQTGALGDVQVILLKDDSGIVTSYELKAKLVTRQDVDVAVAKIARAGFKIDNYLFITTEAIDPIVVEYAKTMYSRLGGTEIAILDCIGFLRHFLHLFHRIRLQFLNAYQELLLEEPESSVRHELKELFLALRQAAETAVE